MNKEKFDKFLLILDEIYKIIDNFIKYSKDMLIYDSFCKLYKDESLSIMERINELR